MSGVGQKSVTDNIKKRFTHLKEQLDNKEDECARLHSRAKEYEESDRKNETDINALNRRIQLLEEELDSTSTRLQTASDMLEEASKAADESERARKVLENKSNLDYERNCELEKLAKSYHQQAAEWEAKYEEVARKNVSLEINLATKEDQCEDREKKLHESDCQLESFSSSIKSFQIAIDKYADNEALYEAEIEKNKQTSTELTAKYDELNNNYRVAVRQIDQLEEECETWKQRYQKSEAEFQNTMMSLEEL